ncbi:MAG: hypothetical protein LBK00_00155 [Treponema sp.]|jgi:hypothetical protein|nr:hypothetical protein [Treponema sp.]
MRNKYIVLCLMAMVLIEAPLVAQESVTDKVSFEMEFDASVLSVDSDGVVDSMTDSGFDEDGTKIGVSYEDELWGASASLTFGNENLRFLSGEIGEMFAGPVLSLDELYAWVRPFGTWVTFTGGIFENKDGVADYTDDIDDFSMGVFIFGEGDEPFSEPEAEFTSPALTNGLLTGLTLGPVTLQFLLAPNYSGDSASALTNSLIEPMSGTPPFIPIETGERFFRIGGRIIGDIDGIGTVSALFKTFQWPMAIINPLENLEGNGPFDGSKVNWTTFGAYFDLTAVENLGVSLGYTGFLPLNDSKDVDSLLYSGIDLRATWTGIEGLSLSTHHNISFAKGMEKDWMGILGKDASFFTLYNAIGATKELTGKLSVNAVVSNVFSTTDDGNSEELKFENLTAGAKLIAKVTEHAEFNIGLNVDFSNTVLKGASDTDESLTVFSIPVGIKVNF